MEHRSVERAARIKGNEVVGHGTFTQVKQSRDKSQLPLLRKLAHRIISMQQDSGAFLAPNVVDLDADYYRGEAMLGLLRLYAVDRNPAWLEAARRGGRYMALIRDKDKKSRCPAA